MILEAVLKDVVGPSPGAERAGSAGKGLLEVAMGLTGPCFTLRPFLDAVCRRATTE